ncbi:universal stress protein [Rhodococcus sp. X156]|uniref:universal stress protein n=1 Tax=Rhodococcus sp. X156 TaxID=2499145 RepID=UPI000FDC698D|nr:universal stress protein [Rhodococcus sp. X156]
MTAYRTVLVGTDGSDSSLLAVERAASLAGDAGARLVIACAYFPASPREVKRASEALREESYQVMGSAPAQDTLQTAHDRAKLAGAGEIETRAVSGAPVDTLLALIDEVKADLLVVGNRGLNSLTGRLLGSVPSDTARKAHCDVLIVHTVQ